MEPEMTPIEKPETLSNTASRVLNKDERVWSCLQNEEMKPEAVPVNWFVGSEARLDGVDHGDLVVLPGDRLPDTPPGEVSANACLYGANTAQFWVLRKAANGYALVISEIAKRPRNIKAEGERTSKYSARRIQPWIRLHKRLPVQRQVVIGDDRRRSSSRPFPLQKSQVVRAVARTKQ